MTVAVHKLSGVAQFRRVKRMDSTSNMATDGLLVCDDREVEY